MKNLIPKPSDGRVRALFKDTKESAQTSLMRAGMSTLASNAKSRLSPKKHNYYQSAAQSNAYNSNNVSGAMQIIDDDQTATLDASTVE